MRKNLSQMPRSAACCLQKTRKNLHHRTMLHKLAQNITVAQATRGCLQVREQHKACCNSSKMRLLPSAVSAAAHAETPTVTQKSSEMSPCAAD